MRFALYVGLYDALIDLEVWGLGRRDWGWTVAVWRWSLSFSAERGWYAGDYKFGVHRFTVPQVDAEIALAFGVVMMMAGVVGTLYALLTLIGSWT